MGGVSVFLYTLRNDGGFAPNPFHGFCTLACCKPKIRAAARPGHWVVGITPRPLGNQLAYAMEVAQVLTFAEYFRDRRFTAKKPRWSGRASLLQKVGDNCYRPLPGDDFEQLPSAHFDRVRWREDPGNKKTDLGGRHVLVAHRFAYFGAAPRKLPALFSKLMPARYHRRVRPDDAAYGAILRYLRALPRGVHAPPRGWRPDEPWEERARCG